MRIKLHRVVKGPIEVLEGWLLICTAEIDDSVSEEEFLFEHLEEANDVVKHLAYSLDPIVYDIGDWEEVIQ